MKNWIVCLFLVGSSSAYAGLLFNYSQLATKDLEQMSKIVQDKIKESHKERGGDKTIPLKEALQSIFCRPNEDDMIEKLIGQVKAALDEHSAYEKTMIKLTTEAIGALRNPKAFKPVVQVTYWVFLENVVSELKPRATHEFEKKILGSISAAKIQLSKEAKQERLMRMMKEGRSPSEIADEALKLAEAPAPPSVPVPAPSK